MAQRVEIILVDDLDGTESEETISFGLDGSNYEIDLNGENASKLREAIAPFKKAGRAQEKKRGRGRGARVTSRGSSTEIRLWAKSKGLPINERGRIPASIVEKYEAAPH